ncbi:phosphatidate cytidylyltransferase [Emcibacter nanhaiensis]|uniref:Phosphatidate cytidylyltransferase n=1 Tax=Emcibacter nanhaiensis TaxID=1505037 RepID=A0A501PQV2_9PROT|nr:CDP-archaeol synthase [Emcibacter nanhaiensis]TPD62910.1 CDP-archaeol synthase [Emcibacter nanhaiensis]
MNNLLLRILSALVMLPVAIALILYGGWVYTAVILLLSVLILQEWNMITTGGWKTPLFFVQAALVLALGVSLKLFGSVSLIDLLVFLNAILLTAILSKKDFKFAVAGGFYALLPALSLIWLREYLPGGAYIILWAMILVWSMDTGAYFAGKKIGGPRMSPKISPNKTWAGLIGGAILALITGTVSARYFGFQPLYQFVIISVVLAVWSQIGDLAESAVKRKFKVKDSGAIIPGHGGILDRVDGILFVMPVVALYLYFGG